MAMSVWLVAERVLYCAAYNIEHCPPYMTSGVIYIIYHGIVSISSKASTIAKIDKKSTFFFFITNLISQKYYRH